MAGAQPEGRPEVTEFCVHRFDRHLVERVRAFTGRIERVYTRAAVVSPEDGGSPLVFLRPRGALVPCGMEVPWERVAPRPGLMVAQAGRLVRAGGSVLRLTGAGQSLRADAPGWRADGFGQRLSALRLPERSRALLGLRQSGSRQERLVAAAAGPGLRRLVGRLLGGATGAESYRHPVGSLAGLGPGSTPTGDDLLAGVCALAWRLCAAGLLSPKSLEGFTATLDELPPYATTRTGREMLAHAARGAFFETLLRFVEALGEGRSKDGIDTAAGRLERTGGKSGCDMLAGVVALAGAFAKGARA
jgi:hypothetical protein